MQEHGPAAHRVEGGRASSPGGMDLAEKTHLEDLAVLKEKRQLVNEQGQTVVMLRGESEQLRAEVEILRAKPSGLAEQAQRDDRDQQSTELTAFRRGASPTRGPT